MNAQTEKAFNDHNKSKFLSHLLYNVQRVMSLRVHLRVVGPTNTAFFRKTAVVASRLRHQVRFDQLEI